MGKEKKMPPGNWRLPGSVVSEGENHALEIKLKTLEFITSLRESVVAIVKKFEEIQDNLEKSSVISGKN